MTRQICFRKEPITTWWPWKVIASILVTEPAFTLRLNVNGVIRLHVWATAHCFYVHWILAVAFTSACLKKCSYTSVFVVWETDTDFKIKQLFSFLTASIKNLCSVKTFLTPDVLYNEYIIHVISHLTIILHFWTICSECPEGILPGRPTLCHCTQT